MDAEKKPKSISREVLLTYCFVGFVVVAVMLDNVWNGGVMSDDFSINRVGLTLVTILFGFGLGWFLYPRKLNLSDEEDANR